MSEFTSSDLRPAEVEAYLRSRNWGFLREVPNGAVWVAPSDVAEDLNVFVPRRTDFADYALRLLEVVRVIGEAERRSDKEIMRDLIDASADIIRFRLPLTYPDASVRLADAMTLFQRAREALRAAALATDQPSVPAYVPGANPKQVDKFLRELRLGHTEPGSYVVPVIAPLGTVEPEPDEVVPRTDSPFGRFVVLRLTSALTAVEEALASARATDSLAPFVEAVHEGVSANLCRSMSELTRVPGAEVSGEQDEWDGIGISVAWSPSRPVPEATRSSFLIGREDGPVLADAAEFLKRMELRPRVTIVGQVVRLEREGDEPEGTIGIRGKLADQDEERMIIVPLQPQDYERALRAHDRRLEVTCSGVLERRGTHLRLADPIEFHAPDVLFEGESEA